MSLLSPWFGRQWSSRRTAAVVLSLAVGSVVLVGCGGSGSGGSEGTKEAGAPAGADATVITMDERLRFVADPATKTAKMITMADGGTVAVSAADGTTYTLDIPAGALSEDTEVTATAASSIKGIDGTKALYGVHLEPEGLSFIGAASLRIKPAKPIEAGHVLPFQADGDGSKPVVAIADPTADGTTLVVSHFSIFGIGELVDHIGDVLIYDKADKKADQISKELQVAAWRREELRERGQDTSEVDLVLAQAFTAYLEEVLTPVIEGTSSGCEGALTVAKVTSDYLHWFEMFKPVGVTSPKALAEQSFLKAEKVCEVERTEACIDAPDHKILLNFWRAMSEWRRRFKFAPKPGDDPYKYVQKAKDTCESYAYLITGGIDQFQVSEIVCDVRKTFVLDGGIAIATFSGGDLQGSYTATGAYGHSTAGTYRISLPDGPGKPGTMTAEGSGSNVGRSGSGQHAYTLAPLSSCD